jgi:S-adenosylmethionine:tRNA ribosyltransferase-isomerase
VDPAAGRWADGGALAGYFGPGDAVVINDAATLPASLFGSADGAPVEVRLLDGSGLAEGTARAVLFGAGDWRTPTEKRAPPPVVRAGAQLELPGRGHDLPVATYRRLGRGHDLPVATYGRLGRGHDLPVATYEPVHAPLHATVTALDPRSPRLVELRFDREGAALIDAIYRVGRPIQYSYLGDDLPLSAVQTAWATRPWSMEMPSAARPITVATLLALKARGVRIATLTHAAGLSSTGDDAIDALLPLPERYEIPAATIAAIRSASRVIAIGTTVARALEGAARKPGGLAPGPGETSLILDADTPLYVVDGLLSGIHVPGESHFRVLAALAPRALLGEAVAHAEESGYLAHEFGDATLVLPGALGAIDRRPLASVA